MKKIFLPVLLFVLISGLAFAGEEEPSNIAAAAATNTLLLLKTDNSLCPNKTVFVSSVAYTGNLGGLDGADSKCNALAADAGVAGYYRAWLSSYPETPVSRFEISLAKDKPYCLVDGTIVANLWAQLTGGTLDSPINLDEYGDPVGDVVWTNTYQNGLYVHFVSTEDWCQSYTSNNPLHVSPYGVSMATDATWTFNSGTVDLYCDSTARIYCFEQ